MKLSLQWAQRLTSTDITGSGAQSIVKKIGAQLGAVEDVIDWRERYTGVVVAKVIDCKRHENADKLSVCLIDDGGKAETVERNDEGLVQVVCGAPNVREGLIVAWLPPGCIVPSTFGTNKPFVLGSRELRGVVSNGMIASPSELGLSDDHSGILEITEDVTPGTPFVTLYSLDDTVIDLENKMFTHRPDCFGVLGVARELAGIQNVRFQSPEWYINEPDFPAASGKDVDIVVDTSLVPRFTALVIDGVHIKPSPIWLQADLLKVGIRPINNIVDITNWVMYTTGQPLHAYDYEKVVQMSGTDKALLRARQSKKGDKLTLLNGKDIVLKDNTTVLICADDVPVGVGGIMGGAATEVDETTKTIIVECATFDMYNVRKSAMKYGLFTEAVTRFNKGQSPLQNGYVQRFVLDLMTEIAGGAMASRFVDVVDATVASVPDVKVTTTFINERLGLNLTATAIAELLRNVEFDVTVTDDTLVVHVPFWRRDIHIAEDIVEEVGRLYGYDKLPVTLPVRRAVATEKNEAAEFKNRLRTILSAAGANEVLSYSFVHEKILTAAGQQPKSAFQLSNAISPDLQYYRLSLLPSLLDKVHMNIKAGHTQFTIYELGKAHIKTAVDSDGLPTEAQRLGFVFAADDKAGKEFEGEAYYYARKYLDNLADRLGVRLMYQPFSDIHKGIVQSQTAQSFYSERSALVFSQDDTFIGIVGEFTATITKGMKLPAFTAGFELELSNLFQVAQGMEAGYVQLPKYPKVTQDITLQGTKDVSYGDIVNALNGALHDVCPQNSHYELNPLDIFESEGKTSFSFRFVISNYARTMTAKEVNDLLDASATTVAQTLGTVRK